MVIIPYSVTVPIIGKHLGLPNFPTNFDIECHSISKLVQTRMWTPSRQSILRRARQWIPIMPRQLSWKSYFFAYEFHIWKNLACFYCTMKKYTTMEMFIRKITYLEKKNMEKLSTFFSTQIATPKIQTEFFFYIF